MKMQQYDVTGMTCAGVQRPCGKSGLKSAGGNLLLRMNADELDGRRGYSVQLGT